MNCCSGYLSCRCWRNSLPLFVKLPFLLLYEVSSHVEKFIIFFLYLYELIVPYNHKENTISRISFPCLTRSLMRAKAAFLGKRDNYPMFICWSLPKKKRVTRSMNKVENLTHFKCDRFRFLTTGSTTMFSSTFSLVP